MRAYLAVIKDSFRETLASRVLWILMALITVLLAAAAPFSLKSEAATRFERSDFSGGSEFLKALAAAERDDKPTLRKHVALLLSDDLRKRLREMPADDVSAQAGILGSIRNEFNSLLDRRDLYDADSAKASALTDAAEKLAARGVDTLTADELRRLNRLLLESAFPGDLVPSSRGALYMSYLGYQFGPELPFAADQAGWLVKTVLASVIGFLAGVLGIFVAILVTSSIIPQMFEPGAIDLLLSKPVSRSLLFLSRFVGACAFVLLNTAYLIGGLWLIVGVQFDIWSPRLLLCIPVFLFLFAIYYSVSALAGVVWRNAVVAVVITILFWAACFSIGTSKDVIETTFLNPKRLSVLISAGDRLLAVNKGNQTFEWSEDLRNWEQVFDSGRPQDLRQFVARNNIVGPVYDTVNERIVAVENVPTRFEAFNGAGKLLVGTKSSSWSRIEGSATPNGVGYLQVATDGTILVAGTSGVHRFEGDPTAAHVPFMIFGRDFGRAKKGGQFVDISARPIPLIRRPFSASLAPDGDSLAVVSDARLFILKKNNAGKFTAGAERSLDVKAAGLVAHAGKTILAAFGNGEIRRYSADTLESLDTYQPFGAQKPRAVVASPDGEYVAVVFHDRHFWLVNARTGVPVEAPFRGRRDISAAAFTKENRLLLSDRFARVTEYEADSFQMIREFSPPSDTLELVYRYALLPIYTIFPKPGQLGNLVSYLLTEEQAVPFERRSEDDLRAERVVVDIWTPVWSNLAFMAVILTATCVYIARHDF